VSAVRELVVVVLHYRTPDLLIDCLASLEGELAGQPGWEVVVVDNASGDGSAQRIERAIAERDWGGFARVIQSPINGGFSAGNNLGMREAPARFHLLLNSDTLVREGTLERLLAAARAHPDAGLLAPRLEWPDGRPQESCFRPATPVSELLRAAATGPLTRLLASFQVALPVPDGPSEPPWASFACILLRHEAREAIGPMDEGFFMYFEDVDYGRRTWKAGFRVRYVPEARVVHLRGGSSSVKAARSAQQRIPAYYYAARNRYFAKYYGGVAGVLVANGAWLVGRGIAALRELVGGKTSRAADREGRDMWRGWRTPLAPPVLPATDGEVGAQG
jgi:N-acetylglucosaminyl-diphospho-decaprenol L-rhamnosyltransferase